MPNRVQLSDEEWRTFYSLLLLNPCVHTGSEENCKRFLNAVLWILRSGIQWRLLPAPLGKWNSVFKRFSRWYERGAWQSLHKGCSQHPDLQQGQHHYSSPCLCRRSCRKAAEAEALGHSKGGFTTKIHAITDALGNPLDFILTEGHATDIGQAEALLQLLSAGAVALLGDKGYDSDAFIQAIQSREMKRLSTSK